MLTTRNFGTVARTVQQDLGFAKLDYHVSDANSLSFSLSGLRWVSPHGIQATGIVFNTGLAIGSNADSTVRDAYGRAQWTSILNTRRQRSPVRLFGTLYDPASADLSGSRFGTLTVNSTSNLGTPIVSPIKSQ
jgi:hypothetical protein